jgi:hypothetical protein
MNELIIKPDSLIPEHLRKEIVPKLAYIDFSPGITIRRPGYFVLAGSGG